MDAPQSFTACGFFYALCYAIGAKKPLIYRAFRARNRGGKGNSPLSLKNGVLLRNTDQSKEERAMAVFRVERNRGYTVMNNHHLRNKELSLKAKRLLSQMPSLPEDGDYTLASAHLDFIKLFRVLAVHEKISILFI